MNWANVVKVPVYNPYTFELARHSRGFTQRQVSMKSGVDLEVVKKIEAGELAPSDDDVKKLAGLLDFPTTFFNQWPETTLDINGCIGKNIPIEYYKYKIFRDVNPPLLSIVK